MNKYKYALRTLLSEDAFWSVNKNIARKIGLEETVFLSDLISKEKYFDDKNQLDDNGGFFNTTENLMSDLGISERAKKRIQNTLIISGLVYVRKRGVPAKNYWYLNHETIFNLMLSSQDVHSKYKNVPTRQDINDTIRCTKTDPTINKNKEIIINNKNKNDYLEELNIIDYYESKNIGQAEPINKNSSTFKNIRATINQYSVEQLQLAIDNMFEDKWSHENRQIRLNRLIKPDKRSQNMFKYLKCKSSKIDDEFKEIDRLIEENKRNDNGLRQVF